MAEVLVSCPACGVRVEAVVEVERVEVNRDQPTPYLVVQFAEATPTHRCAP